MKGTRTAASPRARLSMTSPTRGSAPCAGRASATSPRTKSRAGLSGWDALLAFDRERVWHPYGPLPAALPSLPVVSARGVRIELADGRELIDGMASWWCAIHGYAHPHIDAALRAQLESMAHVMFGVLAQHVFAQRPPDGFDRGLDEGWAAHVSELVSRHGSELAAVILEPVVQGAGGMRFHAPECVALLRALCDEHGLLLVLDEIATGFGRTGALFACEHAGVAPDVMCVGKALTGGYMTLAATLCTRAVADAISAGEGGGLMHGPTFMANPLACSVALASLDLLAGRGGGWRARVEAIEQRLREGLADAAGLSC